MRSDSWYAAPGVFTWKDSDAPSFGWMRNTSVFGAICSRVSCPNIRTGGSRNWTASSEARSRDRGPVPRTAGPDVRARDARADRAEHARVAHPAERRRVAVLPGEDARGRVPAVGTHRGVDGRDGFLLPGDVRRHESARIRDAPARHPHRRRDAVHAERRGRGRVARGRAADRALGAAQAGTDADVPRRFVGTGGGGRAGEGAERAVA